MNREACRDMNVGYGLAVFHKFYNSEYYPVLDFIPEKEKQSKILEAFKLFIKYLQADDSCNYHLQSVTLFGPLGMLYRHSVHNASGLGREVVWLISMLLFSQMRKMNYFLSALNYAVNFTTRWSVFEHTIVNRSFSVSVSGKPGHNIAIDEYVETYLVKPLKVYATGSTTVAMLKRLSLCGTLIRHVRSCYHEDFHAKQKGRHSEPVSLPDQMKVCLFAIRHNLFQPGLSKAVVFDSNGSTDKKVPANLQNVLQKGKDKVKKEFSSKMYHLYEEWRIKD